MAIDMFGLSADETRRAYPEVYQHLLVKVKPERDLNRDKDISTRWWLFGRTRHEIRPALETLHRYIITVETSKHRIFQFLNALILPDNKLIAFAFDGAFVLGVLSSSIHVIWALRAGGWLGVGNDPVYVKSRCFDPFPFPLATERQKQRIRALAEDLDAHRKRVLTEHPHLTLTGLYNVLEKLRAGANPQSFNESDRRVFDDGLVLILKELHDRLDVAVAEAYGWPADLKDEEVLARLVALNKARAAEEARGLVHWLRPEYQIPRFGTARDKAELDLVGGEMGAPAVAARAAFPSGDIAQTGAVMAALAAAPGPLDAKTLARQFKGRKVEESVEEILASLVRTGVVAPAGGGAGYALGRWG